MRIILFAGKGGVGKTTLAVLTAWKAAQLGYKTLIISQDPAHNLSDMLQKKLSYKVTKVTNNLYAQEVDTHQQIKKNWHYVIGHAAAFLREKKGLKSLQAEEVAIIPGLEEVFALTELQYHIDSKKYEVIILDNAPTSYCIRLLSFPEVMDFWVRNIFGLDEMEKKTTVVMKILNRGLTFFPAKSINQLYKTIITTKQLHKKIVKVNKILKDNNRTTIRLVLNPEAMVIEETKHAFTYFNLFGLQVDCVFVNKLLKVDEKESFFSKWLIIQKQYIEMIKKEFYPLPVFEVELYKEELIGEDKIKEFADEIYKDVSPVDIFYKKQLWKIIKQNNTYVLNIYLPFIKKQDIELLKKDNELIIKLGAYKRSIVLPNILRYSKIGEATYDDEEEILKIEFK